MKLLTSVVIVLGIIVSYLPLSLQNAFSIALVAGRHTRHRNSESAAEDHNARHHNASSRGDQEHLQHKSGGVMTVRKEAGNPVYNCSAFNAYINGKIFNGKFKHDYSNCPKEIWLLDMFAADENRQLTDKVLINVGYNKGYSFAEWLAVFAPWTGITSAGWYQGIGSFTEYKIRKPCGICLDCKISFANKINNQSQSILNASAATSHNSFYYPTSSFTSQHSKSRHPYVTIVGLDINPANLGLLKHVVKTIESSKGRANFRHSSLFAITAAAGENNSIVEVQICDVGNEECAVLADGSNGANVSTTKVQQLTVDSLVDVLVHHSIIPSRNDNLTSTSSPLLPPSSPPLVKPVVDILKIDAEGLDPAILNGTRGLLRSSNVRCVIFEAHELGLWSKVNLGDVIAAFDSFDYDCYFEGVARLWPLTGACWVPLFDIDKRWSNVMCVNRRDRWWDTVQKYVVFAG